MGAFDSLRQLFGGSRWDRDDRRNAVRHPAVANEGFLTWWVGEEHVEVPCQVTNIGLLGASIAAEDHPPGDQPLWLRLEAPIRSEWVEAAMAWVLRSEVGVSFPGGCPYDVFQALVPGCSPDGRPRQTVSPEFDGRYWR